MRLFLPKYLSPDLPSASAFTFSLAPDALEADVAPDTAVLFRAPDGEPRVLPAGIHSFSAASMLIFDGDGRLYEAGGELLANTDGRNGSPQLSVTIPSGGFLVAFGPQADARLHACKARAFEGGVLYNATMSVVCGITGSYDAQANRLTVSCPPPEEETAATKRFLFIGNSATYFNGTPLKFKALCRAAGEDVSVAYCTFGSAYLHQYADGANERGAYLRRRLAEKRYDFAVLHDAAAAAYAQSDEALRVLLPLLAENGARPLLYMRYSDKNDDGARLAHTDALEAHYAALSEKYGLPVAPAALAFRSLIRETGGEALYADDRSHHSKAGSYLIACTWLRAFLDISPVGNTYTAGLDAEPVRRLQNAAEDACRPH